MPLLENELAEYTEIVWSSILGLAFRRAAQGEQRPKDEILSTIQIAGEWGGTLVLACPPVLARRIAAAMFGVEPAQVTRDELRDALGEATNMIGGNLKALLPGVCFLSLPKSLDGGDWSAAVPYGREVGRAECASGDERFTVVLFENVPRPAPAG